MDRFGRLRASAIQGEPTPEAGYPGNYITELARRVIAARPNLLELPTDAQFIAARDAAYELQLMEIQESLAGFNVQFDVWFSERVLHAAGEGGSPSLVDEAVDRLRTQGHVLNRTMKFGCARPTSATTRTA